MTNQDGTVGLAGSAFVLAVILTIIVVGTEFLKIDIALLLMFVAMVTSAIYVFYFRFKWDDLLNHGSIPMVSRALGAILILITIGPLIAAWMISGTIPYLIYLGLTLITPKIFLVTALVVTSLASIMTGTSWGSVATFGVAFMGIAQGLGISLPITAGAIVAGGYFGDKLSPISDTTVLAAATGEVDVIQHVRSMLWTTFPAYLIGLVIYAIVGANAAGNLHPQQIDGILQALQGSFHLSPWVLIPPVILLTLSWMRKPTLPVLWFALLSALPLAWWQGFDYQQILDTLADGPSIQTGVEHVDKLLNRGGISFMASAVAVIFFSYLFAGQLEYSGSIRTLANALRDRFIKNSRGRYVFSQSISGILIALGTGNSYLTLILPGTMYRRVCDSMGLSRRVLSRTLEDSGTAVVPLVPWSAAGIYMSQVLNVPVLSYAPWAFMCYLSFVFAWIYGATGIALFNAPSTADTDNTQREYGRKLEASDGAQ